VIVICSNVKCGREIEEPIFLTNLSTKLMEQYDACPYCFTKLIPEKPVESKEVIPSEEDEGYETSMEASSRVFKKVEKLILDSGEIKEKVEETGCPQKFGYLANRPKDTPIPQECLLCPKMVDCMLGTRE